MKIQVNRSEQFLKQLRIEQGVNVPVALEFEVDPTHLSAEVRTLIVDSYDEYPEVCRGLYHTSNTVNPENAFKLKRSGGCLEYFAADIVTGSDAIAAQVILEAKARIDQKHADYLDEAEKQRATQEAAIEAEIQEFLDADKRIANEAQHGAPIKIAWKVALTKDHPRYDEVWAVNEERRKAHAEQEARKEAERKARAEAAAARKAQQIQEWLANDATENQRKRFELDLLPEEELCDSLRAKAFRALDAFPRYTRLTKRDAVCVCSEYNEPDYKFRVYDSGAITAAEFEVMEKLATAIKKDHPDAEVTARTHEVYCDNCYNQDDEDLTVYRKSALVEVTVGEFEFSREYALDVAEEETAPGNE